MLLLLNNKMSTRPITYLTAGVLIGILKKSGGFSEIMNFSGYKDIQLLGTIIMNILLVLVFSEIYWTMDSSSNGKHFGFGEYMDSLYFTTVTSSSTGYGEITPMTKKG